MNNRIKIEARNPSGRRSDQANIKLEKKIKLIKPLVEITTPRKQSSRTDKQQIEVKANTENVTKKSDIEFKVNGRKKLDFDFDYRTGKIRGLVSLKKGKNRIEIYVCNLDGNDKDRVEVEYYVSIAPPKVRITLSLIHI